MLAGLSKDALKVPVVKRKDREIGTAEKRKGPEYAAWGNIKTRCYNPKMAYYHGYGGRGIKVCDRWLESFDNFLEDMGPRPGPEYSIDRIDSNGDYSPENCKWSTSAEQARNKKNNYLITYKGQEKTLSEWGQETGIHQATIETRILELGWTVEEALTRPVKTRKSTRTRKR